MSDEKKNMAKPGGPMTICTVALEKAYETCKFFEPHSAEQKRCRFCAFDEYCICINAYLDVKGFDPQVIDTTN